MWNVSWVQEIAVHLHIRLIPSQGRASNHWHQLGKGLLGYRATTLTSLSMHHSCSALSPLSFCVCCVRMLCAYVVQPYLLCLLYLSAYVVCLDSSIAFLCPVVNLNLNLDFNPFLNMSFWFCVPEKSFQLLLLLREKFYDFKTDLIKIDSSIQWWCILCRFLR